MLFKVRSFCFPGSPTFLTSSSLEVQQAQVQVDHLVSLAIPVCILQVDLTLVGVAVGHVGHCNHVVLFAGDADFTSTSINHVLMEVLAKELAAVGEDFHNLL